MPSTWAAAWPRRWTATCASCRDRRSPEAAREPGFRSDRFGRDIDKIKPVIVAGGSDSATFDNALELLVMAGRSLPHSAMMMVPEAWGAKFHMSEDNRGFYEYHSAMMEPWDGPAAALTPGRAATGPSARLR